MSEEQVVDTTEAANAMALRKQMDKQTYGVFADAVVAMLDDDRVRIVLDDGLPDDDRVEICINKHKLAGLVTKAVAQHLIKDALKLKFFGEEGL